MALKCDSTSSPQRFLWPVCQTNSVMGDLVPNWGPSQWEKMICGTVHISHPILPFLAPTDVVTAQRIHHTHTEEEAKFSTSLQALRTVSSSRLSIKAPCPNLSLSREDERCFWGR